MNNSQLWKSHPFKNGCCRTNNTRRAYRFIVVLINTIKMPVFYCTIKCGSKSNWDNIQFFRIPTQRNFKHEAELNHLSHQSSQKNKWMQMVMIGFVLWHNCIIFIWKISLMCIVSITNLQR